MGEITRCKAKHLMTDTRCIRSAGHDGRCLGPWEPTRPGYLTRAEFASPTSSIPGDHRAYREKFIGKEALR